MKGRCPVCSGFFIYEDLYENGLKIPSFHCILCGRYIFKKDKVQVINYCKKHNRSHCGICERLEIKRKKKEGFNNEYDF